MYSFPGLILSGHPLKIKWFSVCATGSPTPENADREVGGGGGGSGNTAAGADVKRLKKRAREVTF